MSPPRRSDRIAKMTGDRDQPLAPNESSERGPSEDIDIDLESSEHWSDEEPFSVTSSGSDVQFIMSRPTPGSISITDKEMIPLYEERSLRYLARTQHEQVLGPDRTGGFTKSLGEDFTRFSDVRLMVGPKNTVIPTHKIILSEGSTYFERLFASENQKKTTTKVTLHECHPGTVERIVKYIYTGRITHSYHPGHVARMYREASLLEVPEIVNHIKSFLIRNISRQEGSTVYSTTAIEALAQCVATAEAWEGLEEFLWLAMKRPEFYEWVRKDSSARVLDGNATISRLMLQRMALSMVHSNHRIPEGVEDGMIQQDRAVSDGPFQGSECTTHGVADTEREENLELFVGGRLRHPLFWWSRTQTKTQQQT
ncbi:hypothetical protein H072_3836 [Dactylellina haptotyla CBS 200.50]|uniref:BTB domain-containing protein n=1 Tax=Dactylellina haptotyla (strain CBS 200.50) TaxID=1284197 RepID=S8C389_DACHA|nr:hypothetical protein H072_3836 [Dactylellina haptotyla CBS 200.50]